MTELTPLRQRIAVLLVEDHDATRLLTKKILERLGCYVETIGTGHAVVETLYIGTYDIIFLDCVLPDMSGLEIVQAIRRLGGEYATLPIIGITADVVRMGRAECLAAGMSDWLPKPAPVKAYADVLARWVHQNSW